MQCSRLPAASVKGRGGVCDNLAAMLGPKNLGRLVACAAHTLWGVSMLFMVEPTMAINMLSIAIPWPNCECILLNSCLWGQEFETSSKESWENANDSTVSDNKGCCHVNLI